MNSNIQLQWIWWYWLVLEFFCKLIETLAIAWSSDLLAFVWALMIRSVRVWWRTGFKSRLDESHNRQRLSLDLSIFGEFPWLTSDTLHRPCVWIISVAWKEILTIRIAKDFPHHGLPFSFLPSPMHRFLYLPVWAIFCHLFIYLFDLWRAASNPIFPSWTSVGRDSPERKLWLQLDSCLFMYFRLILSLISVCFLKMTSNLACTDCFLRMAACPHVAFNWYQFAVQVCYA